MRRLWFLLNHRLRTSLWLIPLGCAIAGGLLALATIAIDRATGGGLVSQSITGDPNAALQVFTTVAASMVSLTALVLSITAVVVQLAMGQFSPRAVRPFIQDRPSQFAIGIFVGTFAHAMVAMREVRSFTQDGSVPSISVLVSYGLVLVSVLVLVVYVHHIGNALKVDSIIESIGDETRDLLDKLYPSDERTSETHATEGVLRAEKPGTVFRVDADELVDAASEADVRLELTRGVGEFVPEGAPLVVIEGTSDDIDERRVRKAIAVGPERTMDQDGAFGIQTLVDITERALTESFNDQTTAVQAIDRIHDIMRQLAPRPLPSGEYRGSDGTVRVTMPAYDWEGYVSVAFDTVIDASEGAPAVRRKLARVLDDLADVAPPERRPSVQKRLDSL